MDGQWLVEPGYEAVRDLFVAEQGSFGYGGGAYCAYVDGRPVVDIWGGQARPGQPWSAPTSTVIMSATKGFAVLCIQILVDRGQLDPNQLVTDIWPEYGQNGKAQTRIKDFLQHRSGMIGFDGWSDISRYDGTGWDDYAGVVEGFAAAPPAWEPGTKHGYHAVSIGPLLGELVRRVTGMSLGEMFAKEVAGPLGLETWIGTPPDELYRVAHVYPVRTDHMPKMFRRLHDVAFTSMADPQLLIGRAFLADGKGGHLFEHAADLSNNPSFLGVEQASSNGTATARGLARLWALMGNGGELDGVRLLSPEIVQDWSRVITRDPDCTIADLPVPRIAAGMTKAPLPRTLGYLGNIASPGIGARFGPNPDAYGAEGAGGQQSWCDPANRIAVGYVRSELALLDVLQPRLTKELYRCAKRLGHPIQLARKGPAALLVDRAMGSFLRPRVAVPSA